jgi:hypothetical protein
MDYGDLAPTLLGEWITGLTALHLSPPHVSAAQRLDISSIRAILIYEILKKKNNHFSPSLSFLTLAMAAMGVTGCW